MELNCENFDLIKEKVAKNDFGKGVPYVSSGLRLLMNSLFSRNPKLLELDYNSFEAEILQSPWEKEISLRTEPNAMVFVILMNI